MQPTQARDFTLDEEVLAVSLELSKGSWKLALHDGKRDKPTIHTVSNEPNSAIRERARAKSTPGAVSQSPPKRPFN